MFNKLLFYRQNITKLLFYEILHKFTCSKRLRVSVLFYSMSMQAMIAMSFKVTDTRNKLHVGTKITTRKPDKVCCNLDNNMRSSNNRSSSPQ